MYFLYGARIIQNLISRIYTVPKAFFINKKLPVYLSIFHFTLYLQKFELNKFKFNVVIFHFTPKGKVLILHFQRNSKAQFISPVIEAEPPQSMVPWFDSCCIKGYFVCLGAKAMSNKQSNLPRLGLKLFNFKTYLEI
jgi:hypothetical protein